MIKNFFILLFGITIIYSCNPDSEPKQVKFNGEAQGTYYAITYYDVQGRNLQAEIDSLLEDFDQTASMWVENSIISEINRGNSNINPNAIFLELFSKSKSVHKNTEGAFDPTIGPLVNAWGFGFTDRMKVDQAMVDSLLPLVGFYKVKLEDNHIIKSDPRIQFDFNAIAQGYSVDLTGKFLERKGITDYLIDIGGEVLAKGKKPNSESWKVGIEKPVDNATYGEGLSAIVKLDNKALATSGSYRKFYEEDGVRYSHTIDPKSGYPVQHSLLSVSVLTNDCATADAYATAFMVSGLEKSKMMLDGGINDLEAYFIYSDESGRLKTFFTEGFREILVE